MRWNCCLGFKKTKKMLDGVDYKLLKSILWCWTLFWMEKGNWWGKLFGLFAKGQSKLFILPSKTSLLAVHSTHCKFSHIQSKICHNNEKEIYLGINWKKGTLFLDNKIAEIAYSRDGPSHFYTPPGILTIIYILQAVKTSIPTLKQDGTLQLINFLKAGN